jgi:hypothetical protein
MKILLQVLFIFNVFVGLTQTNYDSLKYVDSLKLELIYTYKDKISKQDTVVKSLEDKIITLDAIIAKQGLIIQQDSILFQNYDRQVELLNKNIELYLDHIQKTRPRWYDSKMMWFIGGVATLYAGSLVIKNVK